MCCEVTSLTVLLTCLESADCPRLGGMLVGRWLVQSVGFVLEMVVSGRCALGSLKSVAKKKLKLSDVKAGVALTSGMARLK